MKYFLKMLLIGFIFFVMSIFAFSWFDAYLRMRFK